ncbi:anthranilate synthase component 1 [Halomonas elongata]|uniref:Anthranilate synthase component 1 n=1 Tax=Halomonas elongata TaxID=2746 RepID=A0A1B8NVL3_HALEL|nr:anthranilate synthase component 1 [Halomonas elongata]
MMTPERFQELADAGYNRIPVTREVLADLDTPLSTYLKLADAPWTFLMESVQGGEKWGRYSFIGLPCRERIEVRGFSVEHIVDGQGSGAVEVEDPLTWIEEFQARFKVPQLDDTPRFDGGLVGYFGYDTIRYIEPRLRGVEKPDPLGVPDILLMVCDDLVVFDNLSGRLTLWTHADPPSRTPMPGRSSGSRRWRSGCVAWCWRAAAPVPAVMTSRRTTSTPASARRATRRRWSASRNM